MGPFDQHAKVLLHKDRLLAISRGEFPPPVSVKIELTNSCNHDCHFCAYRRVVQEPRAKDMLKTQSVLSLVAELASRGVQGLMFTGGGEPLLHPGLSEILSRCRQVGIEHGLITNGVRLGRLSDDDLAGLRWIRFSVNAGTEQAYRKVHGVQRDDWQEVWTQIIRGCDRKRFPRLAIGVSFVVTTQNQSGIRAAAERAKAAGVSYVHFRPAFEGPHSQLDRQLNREEQEKAVLLLQELKAMESESFRVYGVVRRFNEIAAPQQRYIHCRSTPLVAYVLPTGNISICTMVRTPDFNPAVSQPFVGNMYDGCFFDFWGQEKHAELVQKLSHSKCGRCHFSVYNQAIESLAEDRMHSAFL